MVYVCFCRKLLRVGAEAFVRVVKIKRNAKDVEPYIEPIWVDVGVHYFFVDGAVLDEMFEVQVPGEIVCVFLAGNERVAHFDKIVLVVSFKSRNVRLVPDFNAYFPEAPVGKFFNGHDTGHRIELINVFL